MLGRSANSVIILRVVTSGSKVPGFSMVWDKFPTGNINYIMSLPLRVRVILFRPPSHRALRYLPLHQVLLHLF